jgi:hypothetical protein
MSKVIDNFRDVIHGSGNLTRGFGSVIGLWGAAGDDEIELTHLKQPAEVVGPYVIVRDHETGRSRVTGKGTLASDARSKRTRDVVTYFRQAGATMAFTKQELSDAGLGSARTLQPILKKLTEEGVLTHTEGVGQGQRATWSLTGQVSEQVSEQVVGNYDSHPLGESPLPTLPTLPTPMATEGWE